MKKWTYHTSHSFIDSDNNKTSCLTQLYQVGVYAIINGDSSMQFNWHPKILVKIEKQLIKDRDKGIIKDLEFGRSITVIEQDGLFKELEP